jgi:hypothetical protein
MTSRTKTKVLPTSPWYLMWCNVIWGVKEHNNNCMFTVAHSSFYSNEEHVGAQSTQNNAWGERSISDMIQKAISKQIHIASVWKQAFPFGSVRDIQLCEQLLAMNNLMKIHYFLNTPLNAFTPNNSTLSLPPSPVISQYTSSLQYFTVKKWTA